MTAPASPPLTDAQVEEITERMSRYAARAHQIGALNDDGYSQGQLHADINQLRRHCSALSARVKELEQDAASPGNKALLQRARSCIVEAESSKRTHMLVAMNDFERLTFLAARSASPSSPENA